MYIATAAFDITSRDSTCTISLWCCIATVAFDTASTTYLTHSTLLFIHQNLEKNENSNNNGKTTTGNAMTKKIVATYPTKLQKTSVSHNHLDAFLISPSNSATKGTNYHQSMSQQHNKLL